MPTLLRLALTFFVTLLLSHEVASQNKFLNRSFSVNDSLYRIEVTRQLDNNYEIKLINDISSKEASFNIVPLKFESFVNGFKLKFKDILVDPSNAESDEVKEMIEEQAKFLFFQTVFESTQSSSTAPIAGKISINDSIPFYYGKKFDDLHKYENKELRITSVHIEVQDGFIQNIIAKADWNEPNDVNLAANVKKRKFIFWEKTDTTGYRETITKNTKKLVFESVYPIGFSSQADYRYFNKIRLREQRHGYLIYLKLSDLLSYDRTLSNNRKDYSPKNFVFDYIPPIKESIMNKEATNRLFEIKVFSDFAGFDNDLPNGLVQTTLDRRINLFTRRMRFRPKYGSNFGFLNYVTPSFTISKIEENQRRLPLTVLSQNIDGELQESAFATSLDLKNYQNFNLSLLLNFFLLDVPSFKSTFHLNGTVHFGRTALVDTARVIENNQIVSTENLIEDGINSIEAGPMVIWELFPDERYGIKFSNTISFYNALSSRFTQISNSSELGQPEDDYNKWLNSLEAEAFFSPSQNSNRIFFRYRLISQINNWDFNFYQAQLGYSFFLKN